MAGPVRGRGLVQGHGITFKAAVAALILAVGFAGGPAAAGPFEDAATAYTRGDYAKALLRPLAEQENDTIPSPCGSLPRSTPRGMLRSHPCLASFLSASGKAKAIAVVLDFVDPDRRAVWRREWECWAERTR